MTYTDINTLLVFVNNTNTTIDINTNIMSSAIHSSNDNIGINNDKNTDNNNNNYDKQITGDR